VAFLTGAKHTTKGLGFFLGSLLLYLWGTTISLLILGGMVLSIMPFAMICLPNELGKSTGSVTLRQVFDKGRNVNVLSGAHFFLFGSRDIWFEIVLPIFLRGYLGRSYAFIGGFMAIWIIFYGAVQSTTPQIVLAPLSCSPPASNTITAWTFILSLSTGSLVLAMHFVLASEDRDAVTGVLIAGLILFAFVFAVNSSVHSCLILTFTNQDKVLTKLTGTLASGLLYEEYGLEVCMWGAVALLVASTIVCAFLGEVPIDIKIDKWGE
jgi:hypothetical protein